VAVGETRAEVEKLIGEAIPMHLEAMRETGEPIPEPHHLAGSVSA
jgi:predicted RNase H-like HicB family nuclease